MKRGVGSCETGGARGGEEVVRNSVPAADNTVEGPDMSQERILVVDDEAAVRGIVAALLERSGYSTVSAGVARKRLWRI